MKKLFTFSILLVICIYGINAQIIHVPDDQPSIQAGIDAASAGDTVLVADSTYYENIDFKGKAITVASHFLVGGDTSHISKTIIDGSQPSHPDTASVVRMVSGEDTTSVLYGFTITGGTGTKFNLNPDYSIIGGGIWVLGGGGKIVSNTITGNILTTSKFGNGGGILCILDSAKSFVLRGNNIKENEIIHSGWAEYGGGIDLVGIGMGGFAVLENNTITSNKIRSTVGDVAGGGVRIYLNLPTCGYDVIVRNNRIEYNEIEGTTYSPYSYGAGMNISYGGAGIDSIITDNCPNPLILNNIINNNVSEHVGGGISVTTWSEVHPDSEIKPQPVLINNTVVDNSSPGSAGLFVFDANPFLMNNIFWNNLSTDTCTEFATPDLTPPLYDPDKQPQNTGQITAVFNNIQGGWEGLGNIDSIPEFEPGTFKLAEGSPGTGQGKYSFEMDGITFYAPQEDIEGTTRLLDICFDIGAFESNLCNTNIAPVSSTDLINLYPNPCRDHLTILMRNNQPVRRVEVLGLDGRILRVADNLQSNPVTIDRGDLPSGLYILRIHAEGLYIKKLLVE